MRAIKIDPFICCVSEIEIEPTLEAFYDEMYCDIIERVSLPNKQDLWVDEVGKLKDNAYFEIADVNGHTHQIAGRAIIVGQIETEGGEDWGHTNMTVLEVSRLINWDF